MGSWQLVLWQPRWIYVEKDALCYTKVTVDDNPTGLPKRIMFHDISDVTLHHDEFTVNCIVRVYTFKALFPDDARVCSRTLERTLAHTLAVDRTVYDTRYCMVSGPGLCVQLTGDDCASHA